MEQQIIANGGVQTVPEIAVQYVYLDFDGALTSYNGEILTVDDVEVQDSSLTENRILKIIEELKDNGLFPEVVTTTSQYIAKVINVILDNKSFPDNWFESKIAQSCAINCTECGKCDEVLKKILKKPEKSRPIYSFVRNKI